MVLIEVDLNLNLLDNILSLNFVDEKIWLKHIKKYMIKRETNYNYLDKFLL